MTEWRDRLRRLMADRGLNMSQLSKAAGLGETAVRDMLDKSKSQFPRIKTLTAVAEQLGVSVDELLLGASSRPQTVPVIGYVSAGEGWMPAGDDGPFDEIEISTGGGEAIALGVRGTSMVPVYRDGDMLIGTKRAKRNADNLIGTDCIIETVSGERYVKFLAKGSRRGRFNLKSYNPAHADIMDVEIAWAAPITMIIRGGR